jgi:hypothetical protein
MSHNYRDWMDALHTAGPAGADDSVQPATTPPNANGRGTASVPAQEWPKAPVLPGPPEPARLDVELLPPVLRDMAVTISASTQAPMDSAIAAVIGGISAAVVGKATVEIRADTCWIKPVNTYIGIEQPSGTGKSPLINFIRNPISHWEAEKAEAEHLHRRWAEERLVIAEARLIEARKQAVKGGSSTSKVGPSVDAALHDVLEAEKQPRGVFQLLVSDATEEEVVRLLAGNRGRIASIDPEGTILELAAGRYSKGGAQLAALTHGWDGEAMRANRVSRDRVDIPSANVALLLGIQPGILSGLANAETMKQRGVLARFLWVAPSIRWDQLRVGTDVPPLDQAAVQRYETTLRRILDTPDKSEGEPHRMKMSPDAQEGVYRLERMRIDGGRPNGKLESVPAFAGKLPDHGSRIAAILTIADRADKNEDLFTPPIPGWAMKAAERLIDSISTHVVKVTGDAGGDAGGDPKILDRQYLLGLCIDMAGSSESDILEKARARDVFKSQRKYAIACLNDLERSHCIRRKPRLRVARSGRAPSPLVEVHPDLMDSEKSEKSEKSDKSDKSESISPVGRETLDDDSQYAVDERIGMQLEGSLDAGPSSASATTPLDRAHDSPPEAFELWPEAPREA